MFTIKSETYNNSSKTIQIHFEITIIPFNEFIKYTLLVFDEEKSHELISYGVDTLEIFLNKLNEPKKFKSWINEITSKFYTTDRCNIIFRCLIDFLSNCHKYFNIKFK